MYSVTFPFTHDCVQNFTPVKEKICFSETLGFPRIFKICTESVSSPTLREPPILALLENLAIHNIIFMLIYTDPEL